LTDWADIQASAPPGASRTCQRNPTRDWRSLSLKLESELAIMTILVLEREVTGLVEANVDESVDETGTGGMELSPSGDLHRR
jgi:hypothetical protein